MSERRVSEVADLEMLIADFRAATQQLNPPKVVLEKASLAVDMLGHVLAEELLVALRGLLCEDDAKTVVGILLENGLTFDNCLDGSVG